MEKTPILTTLTLALLTAPALAGGLPGDVWMAEDKIVTTDVSAGLGTAVDIGNGTAAVSAPGQERVRVLERGGAGWEEVAVMEPGGGASQFGSDLAVDAAGETIVVGAWGSDELFVYDRDQGTWSLGDVLTGSEAGCIGYAVDVSRLGDRLLASDVCEPDVVYLYQREETAWTIEKVFENEEGHSRFGWTVALDSDQAAIASLGDAVTIFEETDGKWTKTATVGLPTTATRGFARSIDVADDHLVVGDPSTHLGGAKTGAAYIYERGDGDGWQRAQTVVPADSNALEPGGEVQFGVSVDIAGQRLVVGAPGDDRLPGQPTGPLDDLSDPACRGVPLSPTCNHPGAAYVFQNDVHGDWSHSAKLTAPDAPPLEPPRWGLWSGSPDAFGASVAVSDGQLAVGAPWADLTPMDEAGSVYLFSEVDADVDGAVGVGPDGDGAVGGGQ